MLQNLNHSSTQLPQSMISNENYIHERIFVHVTDLMRVTGLGRYQAGEYFRKIKVAANILPYVRIIHIKTFMKHLSIECPHLKHITRNDIKKALLAHE